ncbi:hypothetical protein [Roseicyclus elongatus]|uniref:hypothetical protein n=1 Tax=Roseicyclus elongatus TaxID=159346 RepID=UPI0012EB3214|nr:hypothetical protein [Roseibacterium elongatum]
MAEEIIQLETFGEKGKDRKRCSGVTSNYRPFMTQTIWRARPMVEIDRTDAVERIRQAKYHTPRRSNWPFRSSPVTTPQPTATVAHPTRLDFDATV